MTLADLIDQHMEISRKRAAAEERERLSQERLGKALNGVGPVEHAGYVWYRDITRSARVETAPRQWWRGGPPTLAKDAKVEEL